MRFTASLPLSAEACAKLIQLGEDPREALAWLRTGDPLELEPRVARLLRKQAWLIDAERVTERVMVYLARSAGRLHDVDDLNLWLEEGVRLIAIALLEEDRAQYAKNKQWEPPNVGELSLLLCLPPSLVQERLIHFHIQDYKIRQAFFELLIEGKPVIQCLGEGLGPPWLLRERCLRALKALYLTEEEKARHAQGW